MHEACQEKEKTERLSLLNTLVLTRSSLARERMFVYSGRVTQMSRSSQHRDPVYALPKSIRMNHADTILDEWEKGHIKSGSG